MPERFFQTGRYISHWLDAVDEHSLHSPFFFDLYRQIIKADPKPLDVAENLRSKLLNDTREIHVNDLGTGRSGKRVIKDIACNSLTPARYSSLYRQLIERFNLRTVIELGTSFGINTLYLAAPGTSVTTFEGSPEVASIASSTFEFANATNIKLSEGEIDKRLPEELQRISKVDLALLDANHTYAATVRYFNLLVRRIHTRSVMVIDDIHYSREMYQAWTEIKRNPLVHASADLFRCGLLFFDPSLNKQHVILQL